MELIDAAAASRRYVKEIQKLELIQDYRQAQISQERLEALSARLEQAAYDGGAHVTLLFVLLRYESHLCASRPRSNKVCRNVSNNTPLQD